MDMSNVKAIGVVAKSRERARPALLVSALFIALLVAVSSLNGCSSAPATNNEAELKTPLVWPLPPAQPILEYSKTFSSSSDIKGKKGLFASFIELIVGKHEEKIVKPYGVTVDSSKRVIIADTTLKRLHIFDEENNKYSWIGKAKKTKFVSPIGVATDVEDNIYVSDSELRKIFILNKDGKFISIISGDFQRPTGIAINKKDEIIYVVDTWDHNVKAYSLQGKHLFTIGRRGMADGKFNYPTNVYVGNDGTIYITDSMNFRVQLFEQDGTFISLFGHQGDGSGDFARPKGIGVDGDGNIYVVDALFDVVQIFDRRGKYLFGFGGTGQGRGRFWLPGGLFIDEENSIYVADSYNRRVQVFKYLGAEQEES
jgi:DNA-binding beta-propeller fold protein YncE